MPKDKRTTVEALQSAVRYGIKSTPIADGRKFLELYKPARFWRGRGHWTVKMEKTQGVTAQMYCDTREQAEAVAEVLNQTLLKVYDIVNGGELGDKG